jgi:hypothetical protein
VLRFSAVGARGQRPHPPSGQTRRRSPETRRSPVPRGLRSETNAAVSTPASSGSSISPPSQIPMPDDDTDFLA